MIHFHGYLLNGTITAIGPIISKKTGSSDGDEYHMQYGFDIYIDKSLAPVKFVLPRTWDDVGHEEWERQRSMRGEPRWRNADYCQQAVEAREELISLIQ